MFATMQFLQPRFHTQRRWQSEKDTMVQYLDYTKDLHIRLAFTAAPDDKNKKWAWTMPSCTYVNLMVSWLLLLCLAHLGT